MSEIRVEIAKFSAKFDSEKSQIATELESGPNLDGPKLAHHLTQLGNRIEALQKYLTDSTTFLRPYDIRVCQESIKSLRHSLENRLKSIPKKKFAFTARKKEFESKIADAVDGAENIDFSKSILSSSIDTIVCGFDNVSGEKLSKKSDEIDDAEVDLRRLVDCTVRLYGTPSTVRMSGLIRCKVYCGPVKRSIFIDNCVECVLMLACQQLRIHTTVDCDFYLYVTSGPIIEDCARIRVAPYGLRYPGVEADFERSGLKELDNRWDAVNDFNWLAADMGSPNWSVLPSHERQDGGC